MQEIKRDKYLFVEFEVETKDGKRVKLEREQVSFFPKHGTVIDFHRKVDSLFSEFYKKFKRLYSVEEKKGFLSKEVQLHIHSSSNNSSFSDSVNCFRYSVYYRHNKIDVVYLKRNSQEEQEEFNYNYENRVFSPAFLIEKRYIYDLLTAMIVYEIL